MFKTNEQIVAANKAAVDSLLTVANTTLATAERLAALNLNTARAFLDDSVAGFNALLAVKDPQGFAALQVSLAKPAFEKATAYSRSVYDILSQSAKGLSQHAEGQAAELKKTFTDALDQSLKSAPAGSEAVVAAVKTAFAAADSAYDNLSKAAKQATATLEANVAQANKLFAKAA